MTYRALELLNLPESSTPSFLLDIGCGSGLSGEILEEAGHLWVGCDVAPSMLEVALEREVEGDLFLQDIGQGFGFRPGTFDGAIRWVVSALGRSFNLRARPGRSGGARLSLHPLADLPLLNACFPVSPSSSGSSTPTHPRTTRLSDSSASSRPFTRPSSDPPARSSSSTRSRMTKSTSLSPRLNVQASVEVSSSTTRTRARRRSSSCA